MRRVTLLLPVLIAFLAGASPAHAWTWPADGPVLQPFRFGDDPYAAGLHRGIDVAGPPRSPVRAPAAGEITFAGSVPGGGRTVTIRTADGYAVTLLHLGAVDVRRGSAIAEGTAVGTMGSSGTPEHSVPSVHLGVRVAAEPEGYLDPMLFLPPRPEPAAVAEPAPEAVAEPGAPEEALGETAAEAPEEALGETAAEPPAEAPVASVGAVASPVAETAAGEGAAAPATFAGASAAATGTRATGGTAASERVVRADSRNAWSGEDYSTVGAPRKAAPGIGAPVAAHDAEASAAAERAGELRVAAEAAQGRYAPKDATADAVGAATVARTVREPGAVLRPAASARDSSATPAAGRPDGRAPTWFLALLAFGGLAALAAGYCTVRRASAVARPLRAVPQRVRAPHAEVRGPHLVSASDVGGRGLHARPARVETEEHLDTAGQPERPGRIPLVPGYDSRDGDAFSLFVTIGNELTTSRRNGDRHRGCRSDARTRRRALRRNEAERPISGWRFHRLTGRCRSTRDRRRAPDLRGRHVRRGMSDEGRRRRIDGPAPQRVLTRKSA